MKKTIGIIGGMGKMGRAFTRFFQEKGFCVLVSDRHTPLSNTDLAAQSDIVFVSVPISCFTNVIAEIAPFLKRDAILCDITSLKEKPIATMLQHFSGAVVGMHPMFAPSNMHAGQTIVFCGGRGKAQEKVVREMFSEFSCVSLSASEHDKAMALVQGLQHFMEVAYGAALKKIHFPLKELLQVASPVYRMQMALMGRVLSQDESLYANIVFGSSHAQDAISVFLECAKHIATHGKEAFCRDFQEARQYFGYFCEQAQQETDEFINLLAARETPSSPSLSSEAAEIGTLGPQWTWSHLALTHFFPTTSFLLFSSFSAVFSALSEHKIQKAFLPVENTISGSVREVWEGIRMGGYSIETIVEFPIAHVLAANMATTSVRKIFGHAAALTQCKNTLQSFYPDAVHIPVSSNSQAVLRAKTSPDAAAICSQKAAQDEHLSVLHADISDRPGNTTRFALISSSPQQHPHMPATHTSLFFELKNIPGALQSALRVFAQHHTNMIRIESCPIAGKNFSTYGFYIDIEGRCTPEMRQELQTVAKDVVLLGQYTIQRFSE